MYRTMFLGIDSRTAVLPGKVEKVYFTSLRSMEINDIVVSSEIAPYFFFHSIGSDTSISMEAYSSNAERKGILLPNIQYFMEVENKADRPLRFLASIMGTAFLQE